MPDHRAVDIAIEFVERVNRRDFQGLRSLMADNFLCIDEEGNRTRGSAENAAGIEQYTKDYPDFQIHISDVYAKGDTVSIVGRTTGSCSGEGRGAEITKKFLYQIEVHGRFAKSFRYAIPDSEANRAQLGMVDAERITK